MDNIILIIVTSLISGLLATILTIYWQRKSENQRSKREIFEILMSYRYALHLKESVNALNKIDVIFYKDKKVLEAWKNFKNETLRAAQNLNNPNSIQDKQVKLLEEMANAIGYKKINWDNLKDYYFPQGLSSELHEEVLLRRAQLQNTIQSNLQPNSVQLSTNEQAGLALVMKMIETPEGTSKLVELIEKINDSKTKTDNNK